MQGGINFILDIRKLINFPLKSIYNFYNKNLQQNLIKSKNRNLHERKTKNKQNSISCYQNIDTPITLNHLSIYSLLNPVT